MNAEFNITNNVIRDSVYEGILLECNSDLNGVNIVNNTVDGATNAIEVFAPAGDYGHGHGSATVEGLKAENLTGERIVNNNDNFVITDNGGDQGADQGSGDIEEPTDPEGGSDIDNPGQNEGNDPAQPGGSSSNKPKVDPVVVKKVAKVVTVVIRNIFNTLRNIFRW